MNEQYPSKHVMSLSDEVPPNWDDAAYLARYADVAEAVKNGGFANGYAHFIANGLWEGREAATRSQVTKREPWPWSDELYLRANPGLKSALALHGLTATWHYQNAGRREGRPTGLEDVLQEFLDRTELEPWISEEMHKHSEYEPGLDFMPFPAPLHYTPLSKITWAEGMGKVKGYLRQQDYDFAFFLPWLKKGGADLASLYHIASLSARGLRTVVFLTENTDSEWLHRLPADVDVVPFGELFSEANLYCQAQIVYHLISALGPAKVHIINSHAAWEALKRFTRPMKSLAEIYVSLYCYDYTDIDEPVGYARFIRQCVHGVAGIYTDNTTFKNHLADDIGIDPGIIHVLPHPVSHRPLAKPYPHLSRKVLWASRLDRQKQPEILIEIAKRMPFVTFDVFGSAVVEHGDAIVQRLQSVPNIVYKGPFSSPSELTREQYRCFLYTSLWDGLPNILLEMLWAGMTVVAPDIGGIRADLGVDHCMIVKDISSPQAYIDALQWIIQHPSEAEQLRLRGQAYVRRRHNDENFDLALQASHYFPGSTGDDVAVLSEL
ncbi:glycosyltransferase family 4 protein [Pseudoduganella lutea]|uniref:Glycosyltransferase n=1 Tax=Pseudoduganella lutea TaxID=321985 RepID=A0A4P6L093_9BURK|nr:glycosyltransferase family 4 protein [Pseudoduganella lutea]QBE64810.1 glycosyltransferase [Pseudoduganella lutea]